VVFKSLQARNVRLWGYQTAEAHWLSRICREITIGVIGILKQ
jgi:hypothetical protein